MPFATPDLVELLTALVAHALGAGLVWAGLRAKSKPLAALPTLAGLWWPQQWLLAPTLTPGQSLLALALALPVALAAHIASGSHGRRNPLRSARLAVAVAASGLMASLAGAVIGWPSRPPEGVDWIQAALVAAVVWGARSAGSAAHVPAPRRGSRRESPVTNRSGANIDALTGLLTREAFEAKAADAASRATSSSRLALMFIDLDGFKPVNDTYGHSVGDDVLRIVGKRLEKLCRTGDLVARVGGDEFLMLVGQVRSDDMASGAARRIIEALRQTCAVGEREIGISCSIGIAFHPGPDSLAKLIGQADAAMYAAKRAGGSDFAFYTPKMDVDAEDGMQLARDLRRALTNGELELFYQPKVDARTSKITAAEALLRWRHPTRGDVSPAVFIPIAERSGLMAEVSNWVVEDACRQGRVWRDSGLRMRVAINLSPQQMRREDMVDHIAASLKRHRIHPSLLTCEITETLAMEDTRATQETFRKLGELGAHLSIDDFGTGYSSLSYLRQLPARELKIDRSFIVDIESSADARAIVKAILNLAHALGLKVVAEGVESVRQQEILTQLGCDELQGFLFARPMSARSLLIWALSDRSTQSEVFTKSLFSETRQVPLPAPPRKESA